MRRSRPLALPILVVALMPVIAAAQDRGAQPLALTLDDAIARALDASNRMAETQARGSAAAAVADQRRAATMPQVTALAGFTRTNHVDEFGLVGPDQRRTLVAATDRYVAAGRRVAEMLVERWGVPRDRVITVDPFAPIPRRAPDRTGDRALWWAGRVHVLEQSGRRRRRDRLSVGSRQQPGCREHRHGVDTGR